MSSPSPRSFRSRMGNAVRRTSSILSITRPTTPSVHSDSGSVKHLDAPSQLIVPPAPPAQHAAPSPIAESPAREAAESSAPAPVPTGPSPLAQTIVHDEPDDMHPHEARPASVVEEVAKVDEAPKAEETAIEVPNVDEAPPATEVAVEDSRVEEAPRVDEARPAVDETAVASSGANGDAQEANGVVPEADKASVHTQIIDAAVMPDDEPILSPPAPPAAEYTTSENSYFDVKPVRVEEDADKDEQLSNQTTPRPNVTHEEESQTFSAMPVPQPHEAPVRMPSYDLGPSESVWGHSTDSSSDYGKAASTNGDALAHEPAPSARMPVEDPFADPVPPITVTAEDAVIHPSMPEPQVHKEAPQTEETPVVVMPFPEIQDVIAQRSLRTVPSIQSWNANTQTQIVDTDETRPLLPKATVVTGNASYLDTPHPTRVNVSPANGQSPTDWAPPSSPRLHELGWIEYLLPDASFYYVHPTLRVTTDIDLRNSKKLTAVSSYFERYKDGAPVGLELWLCEKKDKGKKRDTALVEWWVDHGKRSVSSERPGERLKVKGGDDAMDMEYRYWSFMESHPAHETIPVQVKAEAMDVLTWSWTERLLPSQRTIPAPFSQDECQELMTLIRSFGDNPGNAGMQGVIQTRIIARILLRVLHWRQMNFRPNKPLPKVSSNLSPLPVRRNPIRKVMVDFVISCLCLGIPYLFYTRSHFHRMDEESGIRSAGPMLIIGACTCLVAAIVLSASVTFLSLPGLDNIARVAGLIAVLFSAFSMASTVVALFKYKADAERAVSVVGAEGFLMVSRRHVVFSLPLVFLSYAVIGFITGLVLYSFRGVTVTNTAILEHRFQEYTSWTVVGVLGGLLGVLTTSILLMRR